MRGASIFLGAALAVGCASGALAQADGNASGSLYSVDLATGSLSRVGTIGDGTPIVGLAFVGDGTSSLYALTEDERLLRFSVVAPAAILAEAEISGLEDGDELVGIDVRPATGDLLAVGTSSTLYTIDPESGEATAIGEPFEPAIDGELVGFDFNPTVDRIRLVTDTGQNLRLNPETGLIGVNPDTDEPTIDGEAAYADGDDNADATASLSGAGYTNSVEGAESTVLYVIDTDTGVLAIQDPPNEGVLNTVGDLGVELDGQFGFDIAPTGAAYAAR